jgi:hypothetical protein
MAKIRKLNKKTKLAIIVSLVSMLMLFLVTPSAATNVNIGGPPYAVQGNNLDFWVEIDIYDCEQVPIEYICVDMHGAGEAYVKFNPNGEIIDQSGGFSILSASFPAPNYGFTYCDENWGYGYMYSGYDPYGFLCPYGETIEEGIIPREMAESLKHDEDVHMGPGWGYGYGQEGFYGGCYPGAVTLKYRIRWNTTGQPLGTYYADARTGTPMFNKLYGFASLVGLGIISPEDFAEILDDIGLISCGFRNTSPYPFLILSPGGGGGGGGGGGEEGAGPELGPVTYGCSDFNKCVFDLSYIIGRDGRTTRDIVFNFEGLGISLFIPAGTKMVGPDGTPLLQLILTLLHTPPVPEGWGMVGNAIECEPSGTTFTPPITMTWNYNQADVPEGGSESGIAMAYWDGAEWTYLNTSVDTAANTASASISHFTPFALLTEISAEAPPEAPPEEAPPAEEAPPEEAPGEEAPTPVAWWIWVIAGVVVVGIVVWLIARRQAA